MTDPESDIFTATTRDGRTNRYFLSLIVTLVMVTGLGFWMIIRFANSEAEIGIQNWQERLNLIADSRVEEASEWLLDHLTDIEDLATDPSLQLYASEIAYSGSATAAEAQRSYVFSLLSAAADRYGFYEERAVDQVAANVRRLTRAGIALFDRDGQALVASSGMPALRAQDFPREIGIDPSSGFIHLGPQLDDRKPLVLFGAPILAGEGVGDELSASADIVGWIVAAKPLGETFYETLKQPGALEETAETYVFTLGDGSIITPITPLLGGGRLLEPREDQASAEAGRSPGGFLIGTNYTKNQVLITAREFSAPVDWLLARSITAEESLSAVYARRTNLIATLMTAGILIIMVIVLVWRLGVSRRLELSYAKEAALSRHNSALSSFLTGVANAQPSPVAAVSKDLDVAFANKRVANLTGVAVDDLTGRRLDTAFPHEIAIHLRKSIAAAIETGKNVQRLKLDRAGEPRAYQLRSVKLPEEAVSINKASADAVIVFEDVTELTQAQERSEALLSQLIQTLTMIIDARDPWSRHHSVRVAKVAEAIAVEKGLGASVQETVRTAGQLVNVGKIFVPIDILTKDTPLTEEELHMVQGSMQQGAELISSMDFKGPVSGALSQFKAHMDGSGQPKGLANDDIILEARILAVANAFVAMVSARAHRASLGFDKAMDLLQKDSGSIYDRSTVAALYNLLENKGARTDWSDFTEVPTDQ